MAQNVAVTAVNAAEMRELALLTAAAVAEIKPNGGFELVSAVHSGCLHAVLAADNLGTHEAGENELKTLFAPLWWDEIPQGTDASVLGRGFMSCWQAAKILDDKDLQSRAAKQLLWAVTNAEVNFVGVWMLSELASLCERWQDFEVATVLGHVVRAHQFDEASRDGLLYCSDFYEVRQFGQLLLPVLWRFVELCLQGHSFPDSFAGKLTDITSPVKEMRAAVPTKEADRISMIISVLQIASGLPADFVPPGMVSSSVSLAVGLESAVPKAWRAKLLLATRAAVASGCGRSATAEALQGEMEVLWPWLLQLCSEASSESKGEVQHCSATIMGSVVFAVATSELNSTESKPEHALHSLLTACLLPAAVSRATPGVLAMVAAALQAIHRALSQTSSSTLPPQWLEYLEQLEGAAMKHVHKAKTSALLPVIGELLVLHTERASTKRDDEQAQASPLLRQLGLAVSAAMRQCVAAPEDPAPITFVTKLAEALPQLRPKPSRTDFRVILCAVLHSLGKLVAKGQKDPPLFAALSAIAAGVDDECCSELMTALSSEMASAIPIRNLVALNVTKNLMDTLAARRLTLLFSSNNFRVLPQLAELLTQRHNGPLDAELAATSLKLLHELVTRERVFRLTARHISVIMSVVSHCLADSFPITGEAAKAECGSAAVAKYELLVAILLAMVNHRAAVSRSCQPSSSGCLRWMLVALAEHCLPSSSARQLSRLLEATSSDPQASFKKHAAYFISDYIQVFHGFSVGEELLRELRPGVFAMLAACEDEERKLIHNSAPPVGKTYFKQLVADYNDYYKYKGGS